MPWEIEDQATKSRKARRDEADEDFGAQPQRRGKRSVIQQSASQGKVRLGAKKNGAGQKGLFSSPLVWLASAAPVIGLILVFLNLPRAQTSPGVLSSDAVAASNSSPVVAPAGPKFSEKGKPFVNKFCIDCHTGMNAEAGIALDSAVDDATLLKDRKRWERALSMVQAGIMPPDDSTQPTAEERQEFLAYLDSTLFKVDCSSGVDPGKVTIRRLNRVEYNNTIRDLLGVTIRPADAFPSDDVGYGFDNIGDVLSLPPLLMEKYLTAAEQVAAAAINAVDPTNLPSQRFGFSTFKRSQVAHKHWDEDSPEATMLVSNGDVTAEPHVSVGGKYLGRIKAGETPAGNEHAKIEIKVDGQKVYAFDVMTEVSKPKDYEFEISLSPGQHAISIAFMNDFFDDQTKNPNRKDRNALIYDFELKGPVWIDPSQNGEIHKRIIASTPKDAADLRDSAEFNLGPLLERAFRRPVRREELQTYVALVEQTVKEGESFEVAMQVALQAILVSPHFLFRLENDVSNAIGTGPGKLSDYELATRMSYFLWSSMPDNELFKLAKEGKLKDDAVLAAQVERMLRDPKANSLVENFADQWLQLRNLDEVRPDPTVFANFDDGLRWAMKEETRRLFAHVMRENRSILEFLDADYTFVNKRLAEHYGLPQPASDEFQKVSLGPSQRSGLLTHASVLTITSNPGRTSPVKRGKWIMETILNTPLPPPPPNVPELADAKAGSQSLSLRQQMEEHRKNPACASCHKQMDVLGFGMENFDAIGRYRDQTDGLPVDSSGTLPDGATFSGPQQLSKLLKEKRRADFVRCLSEKMLTYALGRGLEFYDRCTVTRIATELDRSEYRFNTLILEIVKSEPFRLRRGEGAAL